MKCPSCSNASYISDSRSSERPDARKYKVPMRVKALLPGNWRVRRRRCHECGIGWNTLELHVLDINAMIVKAGEY